MVQLRCLKNLDLWIGFTARDLQLFQSCFFLPSGIRETDMLIKDFSSKSWILLTAICTCWGLMSAASATDEVTFDWVVVGDVTNAPDQLYTLNNPDDLLFGGVDYVYRISKHEVTNAQYACFLNKIAADDPNGVYNPNMPGVTRSGSPGSYTYSVQVGMEQRPATYVSYFDVMRFINWLENGQPTGAQDASTTEAGVYVIDDGINESRAVDATFFVPSENEWYKAAYHDPRLAAAGGPPTNDHYWFYGTGSDTLPVAEMPPGGTNSANYALVNTSNGNTTDVGAYINTTSYYGAHDMVGNVHEWVDASVYGVFRIYRGGCWVNSTAYLDASYRLTAVPTHEGDQFGFRVASAYLDPIVVPPTSYTVIRGDHRSGGLAELAHSDGLDFVMFRRAYDVFSRTMVGVKATSPFPNPSMFEFTLEGAVFARYRVSQNIELYDYMAGRWERVDTRDASRFGDSTVVVTPTGDLSRFVEPGTNCIEAQIRYNASAHRAQFSSFTDQIIWTIAR